LSLIVAFPVPESRRAAAWAKLNRRSLIGHRAAGKSLPISFFASNLIGERALFAQIAPEKSLTSKTEIAIIGTRITAKSRFYP
jgi:hypothetical protein